MNAIYRTPSTHVSCISSMCVKYHSLSKNSNAVSKSSFCHCHITIKFWIDRNVYLYLPTENKITYILATKQPSLHPLHPHNTDLTYLLSSSLAPPAGYPLTTSHTYSTPELNTFLDSNQQHRGQYCHTFLTFAKLGHLYSFEVKCLIDEMWIISISTVKVFPCFSWSP